MSILSSFAGTALSKSLRGFWYWDANIGPYENDLTNWPVISYTTPLGSNYPMGLSGAAQTFPQTWLDNSSGYSVGFDGSSYWITPDLNNSNLWSISDNGGSFTMEIWFYPTANNTVLVQELGQNDLLSGWYVSTVEIGPSGNIVGVVFNGTLGNGDNVSTTNTVTLNDWNFMSMSYDSSTNQVVLQLNDVQTTSVVGQRSTPWGSGHGLHYALGLGSITHITNGNDYQGQIAVFRLWNYVRQSTSYGYDCTRFIFGAGLHCNVYNAYWGDPNGTLESNTDDPTWFDNNFGLLREAYSTTTINFAQDTVPATTSYLFEGYFMPTTTETYTWTLSSDDASYVWFGPPAESGYTTGNSFLTLGGIHGVDSNTSNQMSMEQGQLYPIRIEYGNNQGGSGLTLQFSTPSLGSVSSIPSNQLFHNPLTNGF